MGTLLADEARDGAVLAKDGCGDRMLLIVEAASDLLEEQGLDGLTIRAVLGRTGLSRRAFYERFPGKDELVLAVFEHTMRLAASHYQALVAPVADPLRRLELVLSSIALAKPDPSAPDDAGPNHRAAAMSREHLRLAQSHPEALQAALSPLIDLIADQIAAGVETGQVRACQPQRLATLVYNLVSTTVHAEYLAEESDGHSDPARRAAIAAEIWEFCRRAIAA